MDDKMKMIVDHVTYQYDQDTSRTVTALKDISFVIGGGEFIGLIGHTGSGKSTLVQHLNGLLRPTVGTVYFEGEDIFEKGYDRKKLRSKVGLVFQYPEHQLFAETVFEDVCFGPKNMGLGRKEAELKAYEALKQVGLEDDFFYQPPFDLSGGQKRRVAIAGVLAMKPEILVLDEPAAGLDPKGKEDLLQMIKKLQEESGITVVMVSHSMEDVANYAGRILVMDQGSLLFDDTPKKVFAHAEELEHIGLMAPQVTYLMRDLLAQGMDVKQDITTVDEAAEELLSLYRRKKEAAF